MKTGPRIVNLLLFLAEVALAALAVHFVMDDRLWNLGWLLPLYFVLFLPMLAAARRLDSPELNDGRWLDSDGDFLPIMKSRLLVKAAWLWLSTLMFAAFAYFISETELLGIVIAWTVAAVWAVLAIFASVKLYRVTRDRAKGIRDGYVAREFSGGNILSIDDDWTPREP